MRAIRSGPFAFAELLARPDEPFLPVSRSAAKRPGRSQDARELADAYDNAQTQRGSPLRANRGV